MSFNDLSQVSLPDKKRWDSNVDNRFMNYHELMKDI